MRTAHVQSLQNNHTHNYLQSMNRDFSNVDWQPVLNETNKNTSLILFNKCLTENFNRQAKIIEKKVKGRK